MNLGYHAAERETSDWQSHEEFAPVVMNFSLLDYF